MQQQLFLFLRSASLSVFKIGQVPRMVRHSGICFGFIPVILFCRKYMVTASKGSAMELQGFQSGVRVFK